MLEQYSGTSNIKKIVVYSPYITEDKNNMGDRYFIDAFQNIFPDFDFTFLEEIKNQDLSIYDAIFFGGGSFLDAEPLISAQAFEQIKKMSIFYIGVGCETNIHPKHIELMTLAKLIATRSKEQISKLLKINKNSKYCPDIVYSLKDKIISQPTNPKKILLIANGILVPDIKSEMWQHTAWQYFKVQISTFLYQLLLLGYSVDYLAMCKNSRVDDFAASYEIISMSQARHYEAQLQNQPTDFKSITTLLSQYQVIITQRYHGIVLSELCQVPYIAIHHHDKLKNSCPNSGLFMDYYGLSKEKLMDNFNLALNIKKNDFQTIELHNFELLKKEVEGLI